MLEELKDPDMDIVSTYPPNKFKMFQAAMTQSFSFYKDHIFGRKTKENSRVEILTIQADSLKIQLSLESDQRNCNQPVF